MNHIDRYFPNRVDYTDLPEYHVDFDTQAELEAIPWVAARLNRPNCTGIFFHESTPNMLFTSHIENDEIKNWGLGRVKNTEGLLYWTIMRDGSWSIKAKALE